MPDILGGMNMGFVGNLVALVGVAGLDKFERDLQGMASSVDGKAKFINKSMTAAAAAGAMVFVSSIAAATEFQSSFTGVTKTVDGLSDNFGNLTGEGQRLADQFRKLALEVPVSVNELNRIGELAGQLGVGKEDILEFTRTIAALGVTTNLTFEEGATQIARFTNVTKLVAPAGASMAEQAERIGSTVVELGNNMATTESEIVQFGLRIAGAGAQIGLSQDQILAFGAALSSVGINAEAGGTSISKLFIDMAKAVELGGSQLERYNEIVPGFAKLFKEDAAGALNKFFVSLNETQKSSESLFPTIEDLGFTEVRLRDTILKTASASDILTKALGWSAGAYKENTAMANEAAKRYSTFESQLKLFDNAVNDAAITLGNKMLPALNDVFSIINSNNAVVTTLLDTVGTMVLVLGGLAVAIKTYRATSALWQAANVALNGSFGPVLLAVTALVAAITAIKVAQDKHQESILRGIDAVSDQTREIEKLELQYNNLSKQTDLTVAEQEELKKITDELDGLYRNNGISIMEMANSFGSLSSEIRAAKLDDLRIRLAEINAEIEEKKGNRFLDYSAQIKLLKEETAALTGEIKELSSMEATYQKLNINTTESMKEQVAALEAVRSQTEKGTVQYKELTDRIEQLKNKLDEAAGKKAPIDWQKAIADAGYKTVQSIQAQIREIETLMKHVEPGSSPYLQMKDDVENLYQSLGKRAPWDPAARGMAGFKAMAADTSGELSKLRVNFEDYFKVQTDYADKWDVMADAGIESSDALQRQIDKLEFLKGSYPLTAYEMDQVNERLKQLRGETDEGSKSWVEYAGYINDLTQRLGSGGELIGKGINLFVSAFQSGFDPITLGINALSFGMELFGKKSEPIPKTIEEIEASLGSLQTRIEETNSLIGSLGLNSDYLEGLQNAIDSFKEDMRTASGYWYEALRSHIEEMQSVLENLTYAFSFEGAFSEVAGNLDALLEKGKYYIDYFRSIDMSGFSVLLLQEIQNSLDMLDTLDPLSKAYEDLNQKIKDSYLLHSQLVEPTNALMTLYPEMYLGLAKIYEQSKLVEEAREDEGLLLDRLSTSELIHATDIQKQIDLYTELLPLLTEGSKEYEAIKNILDMIGNTVPETNRVIGEAKTSFDEMKTSVEESTKAVREFNAAMQAVGEGFRSEFTNFKTELENAKKAIDEILFFHIDLDTTMADEQIEAIMQKWLMYLNSLDRNSPAFKEGLAALQELWQHYLGMRETMAGGGDDVSNFGDAVVRSARIAASEVERLGTAYSKVAQIAREAERGFGTPVDGGGIRIGFDVEPTVPPKVIKDVLGEISDIVDDSSQILAQKYANMQGQLDAARAYLDLLQGEEAQRLAEIDERYTVIMAQKTAEQSELETIISDLWVQRRAIIDEYKTQMDSLHLTASEIDSFLLSLMRSDDPLFLHKLEDGIESLAGVTRTFLKDWENMLDTLSGGATSEFNEMTQTAESARKAIEQAKYFSLDLGGTEIGSEINAMIYSMMDFVNELNPESQAFKDAQETIRQLRADFMAIGGVLDRNAAEQSAIEWAQQLAEQMRQQAEKLNEEKNAAVLPLNLELGEAYNALASLNGEIQTIAEQWKREKLEVGVEITNAMNAIDLLGQRIDSFFEKYRGQLLGINLDVDTTDLDEKAIQSIEGLSSKLENNPFILDLDTDDATGSLNALDTELGDLFTNWNGKQINVGLVYEVAPISKPPAGLDLEGANQILAGGGNGVNVNIYGATPDTWAEISDNEIEPRLNERDRKYSVGSNPYGVNP